MSPSSRPPFESLEQRLLFAVYAAGNSPDAAPISANVTALAEEWSSAAWALDTSAARDRFALYGHGQTVAIIDSGIAYDHAALGAGLGTDYRVVGGWDFAENDADPYDDGPLGFHGTHVAGIVGSSDETYAGVASGVDLVALRVFDDQGNGEAEWIADALWWVHQHQSDYENPITTVNLSLGLDDLQAATAASIESALQALEQDGIFITVSAGNDFDGSTNLKHPADSEYVVPVASVGEDGLLSDFSQRNSRILAAPGEMITSTAPDYLYSFDGVTDDFIAASGTSMAAPHIAGASVLVREVFSNLGESDKTQAELYNHLLQTSDVIQDVKTAQTYRRVNLSAAIEAALGPDEAGADADAAAPLGTVAHQMSFSSVINELTDIDTFTFVAGATGTLHFETGWSGSSSTPELTLAGGFFDDGVHVGAGEYRVQAGQEYTLTLADADAVGRYEANMRLTPVSANPIAAAPSSQSNETSYHWTAAQTGWYEFDIELQQASSSDHVRIYAANNELVYASSQMFTEHIAQLYVEAGGQIRIALSGSNPNATITATSLNITSGGGDGLDGLGGPQGSAGHFEGLAAVVFTSPDQVHQLAWASSREIAFEDTDPTLAADSALAGTIDQPWLAAIAASKPVKINIARAALLAKGDGHHVKTGEPQHITLADEWFASPASDNLLRD